MWIWEKKLLWSVTKQKNAGVTKLNTIQVKPRFKVTLYVPYSKRSELHDLARFDSPYHFKKHQALINSQLDKVDHKDLL